MNKIKWRHLSVLIILMVLGVSNRNTAAHSTDTGGRWHKEIRSIEQRYDGRCPAGVVVFTGSSSIAAWTTLAADMAPLKVVNHGFGGATVSDVTRYADRIVAPFKPKAVVVFAGTNDINGIPGKTHTAGRVFRDVTVLFDKIRSRLPRVPIYYISITPTELRWRVWPEARQANARIQAFCRKHEGLHFIDITPHVMNEKGKPNNTLYKADRLHPNRSGYKVWTSAIRPVLLRDLYGK
ncbi:GDSL-type esterase/lipase family protein [uncultured Paenibacillus sp.]|uniref:GDSL-type esterase/lipase family protein n=1 Tax=uncultured Paenibacillus sp. TaxID=227322 RepID=UPI0028D2A4E3|nr:GDSL-type esterase/lipase family protein [uncultured Paenibacillus sp.]